VAVEASGGGYWFLDKLETAGLDVRLFKPTRIQKADERQEQHRQTRRDRFGNAASQWTLPEVWIPPAELRDLPGMMPARLSLRCHTTIL
jgi:hypothetical protein